MITIKRERWIDCIDQIMPLCEMVHEIVEQQIYQRPLDFDSELFQELDSNDVLHCLVMRDGGVPIGFHWLMIAPLMRFKGKTHAYSDAIFVHPDYRKHSAKLIRFSQEYIENHGCLSWVLATLDPEYRGEVWQRKGFKKAETIFIKVM